MAPTKVGVPGVCVWRRMPQSSKMARAPRPILTLWRVVSASSTNAKIGGAAIGMAAVAATVVISNGVRDAIDRVSKIADLAEKVGVPVEAIGAFAIEGAIDTLSSDRVLPLTLVSIGSGDPLTMQCKEHAALKH